MDEKSTGDFPPTGEWTTQHFANTLVHFIQYMPGEKRGIDRVQRVLTNEYSIVS